MAGLSYPLKRLIRRGLLGNLSQGTLRPVLTPSAFEPYRLLFAANHFDGHQTWRFNGQQITIDDAFLFNPIDKTDYTYRIVFFHFEWMFQTEVPDVVTFEKLYGRLEQSAMFFHPSPLSQRCFVLAWVLAHLEHPGRFKGHVLNGLRHLIVSTEDSVCANHLIDNFLAIALLAEMLGLDRIVSWAMLWLRKSCADWVMAGYYYEKTPCYQALLLGRVRLVQVALSANGRRADVAFLGQMASVLQRFPAVHMHDSYLPRAQWQTLAAKPAPYARSLSLGACMNLTLVTDARSDRGYRGHVHDASGALFIHHQDGTQVIGGKGTATYKTSPQRDACRGAMAYCIPYPRCGHTPRLTPWKSFRHTRCRSVDVHDLSRPGAVDVTFHDRRGSGARWSWQGTASQILLTCDRPNVLGFWSDIDPARFATIVSIRGNSSPVTTRPCTRFDGIGNPVSCYFYETAFEKNLILDIKV